MRLSNLVLLVLGLVVGASTLAAQSPQAPGNEVLALELDLDDAAKHEVPAAVELVRRSKHFTALLDEAPDPVLLAATPDAGAGESIGAW